MVKDIDIEKQEPIKAKEMKLSLVVAPTDTEMISPPAVSPTLTATKMILPLAVIL